MRFAYVHSADSYPQNMHLISGFRELGHEVIEIRVKGGLRAIPSIRKRLRAEAQGVDAVFVGFTSPLMVFAAYASGAQKIIFNATASQYEANIISRGEVGHFFLSAIKWWLVDFFSFHLSTKVLLESDAQVKFVRSRFFVSRKKLVRAFSGLDEEHFFYDPGVAKLPQFTVVFRGRFLPESGVLTVIEAAKKLEHAGVNVRLIGGGMMYREVNALVAKLKPRNLEMPGHDIATGDLRKMMLECHVSLGQVARHPRLKRTLPCKLFESLALRLPYLTGRNAAVFELLEEGATCLAVNPGDADDLAEKIIYLRDNPEARERIAKAGYELYQAKLTSKVLAQEVIDTCFNQPR